VKSLQHETNTLESVLRRAIESYVLEMHTAIPVIVDLNNGDGTVNATIAIKKVMEDGSDYVSPTIPNIPIAYNSNVNYSVTFPVAKGDEGLLIVSERDISAFKELGEISLPIVFRTHDFSDSVFIPMNLSDNNRNVSLDADGLELKDNIGGARIQMLNGFINLFGTVMFESVPNSGIADVILNTHSHPPDGTTPPV